MTTPGCRIAARSLGKWYGHVLGLSEVSLEIGPGITGLLGPNGAGKSTFLKLLTGQLRPSIGRVEIDGRAPWNATALFSRIGVCPEQDAFYEDLTGWEFLFHLLKLHGFLPAEARAKAEAALGFVELLADKDRLIRGYSRGMRQRLKLAQALAHEPELLILDEPLNGLDPLSKRKVIRWIKEFQASGRTVIVSSHVLPEIEALTRTIVLIHQGKILAQGDIHYIRDLIDAHPHVVSVRTGDPRKLASLLVGDPSVLSLSFGDTADEIVLETRNRDRLFGLLPGLISAHGLDVEEIASPDDNLQAVFDYLVER